MLTRLKCFLLRRNLRNPNKCSEAEDELVRLVAHSTPTTASLALDSIVHVLRGAHVAAKIAAARVVVRVGWNGPLCDTSERNRITSLAANALASVSEESAVVVLFSLLKSAGQIVVPALARARHIPLQRFKQELSDSPHSPHHNLIDVLVRRGSSDCTPLILRELNSSENSEAALDALKKLGPATAPHLLRVITGMDATVSSAQWDTVFHILAATGNNEACEAIAKFLNREHGCAMCKLSMQDWDTQRYPIDVPSFAVMVAGKLQLGAASALYALGTREALLQLAGLANSGNENLERWREMAAIRLDVGRLEVLKQLGAEGLAQTLNLARNPRGDDTIRLKAVDQLLKLGSAGLPSLSQLLMDPQASNSAKIHALAALSEMKAPGVVEVYLSVLESDCPRDVQDAAIDGLVKYPATPRVIDALLSKLNPGVPRFTSFRAVKALGELKAKQHADAVVEFLTRPISPDVAIAGKLDWDYRTARSHVANALAQMGDSRAVQLVIEFFEEGDSFVFASEYKNTLEVFARVADSASVGPLIDCLNTPNLAGFASALLANTGDTRAVEPLYESLLRTGNLGTAEALAQMGAGERTIERMSEALRQAPNWSIADFLIRRESLQGDEAILQFAVKQVGITEVQRDQILSLLRRNGRKIQKTTLWEIANMKDSYYLVPHNRWVSDSGDDRDTERHYDRVPVGLSEVRLLAANYHLRHD